MIVPNRECRRMIERMTETSAAENGLKDFNLGQPGGVDLPAASPAS
jgi:hypothetical protein